MFPKMQQQQKCCNTHKHNVPGDFLKIIPNYSKSSCQPFYFFLPKFSCILWVVENYQIGSDTSLYAQIFMTLSELQSRFEPF